MKSTICMSCTYQRRGRKVQAMQRISEILNRFNLNRPERITRFNWGNVESCKVGISTCDKIEANKREFNRYAEELNNLLSAFAENPKPNTYHDILQYLRGNFPAVYVQFEQLVRPRLDGDF